MLKKIMEWLQHIFKPRPKKFENNKPSPMPRPYRPRHYMLQDLAHPDLIRDFGDRLWLIFSPRILQFADFVWDKYGECFINVDTLVNRGFVPFDSTSRGAALSAHRFGRAVDISIVAIDSKFPRGSQERANAYTTVRRELLALPEWEDINFEMTFDGAPISWLHADDYNRPSREFAA